MVSVPIRIALIDDYEVVLKGLARMFENYADRVVVVELDANTPVSEPVDIAMYDTFAQPQSDKDDVESIIRRPNATRVVFYSWNLSPDLVRAALTRGVDGYLGKHLPAAELVDALERIHRGEVVTTPGPEARPPVVGGDWPGRVEGLSIRESEIIALITQGHSNKEVAAYTYLSVNSVKSYIRSAYRKMGVSSRSQAVLWGIRHGFLPDHKRM